jgi:hypothetical protein
MPSVFSSRRHRWRLLRKRQSADNFQVTAGLIPAPQSQNGAIVVRMNEHQSDNAPAQSRWRLACVCALSDGVPLRSLCVALVVGTVLNLINQGMRS